MSELAAASELTRSHVTRRVDTLAADDLVRREFDDDDRRGVLAAITDDGSRVLAAAAAIYVRHEKAFRAALGDSDDLRSEPVAAQRMWIVRDPSRESVRLEGCPSRRLGPTVSRRVASHWS